MKPSEYFTKMAESIDRNPEEFGGAIVIVPPGLGGDPVRRLVVSGGGDDVSAAVFFWNIVQSEVQAMLAKLQDKERSVAAFGRR